METSTAVEALRRRHLVGWESKEEELSLTNWAVARPRLATSSAQEVTRPSLVELLRYNVPGRPSVRMVNDPPKKCISLQER